MSPLPPESPASMIPSPDNMPGDFTQRPSWNFIGNIGTLAVFLVVCAITVPFFFLYPYFFGDRSSRDHFLVNLPLPGLEEIELLEGPAETVIPLNLGESVVVLILWGPWDDDSCRLMSMLAPLLNDMKAAENLVVVPVAYFAAPPHKETQGMIEDADSFKAEIAYLRKQKEPLRLTVERAYNAHGFSFPAVWWDPMDALRTDLVQMGVNSPEVARERVDGIGMPTIILAQHGIITAVWTKNAIQNLSEIRQQLIIATNFVPGEAADVPAAEPGTEPVAQPVETLEERVSEIL